jgi:hypothetical protein
VETITLKLDETTLERFRRLAETRRCTLEELIQEIIEQAGRVEVGNDLLLGMFAQEPELIDQVLALALKAREDDPLRGNGG